MTGLPRVLIVEDYEPFRRALSSLLRRRGDVVIVGEATDGLDAIEQAEALRPDVVALDIGLPSMSGIEAATRIHAAVPDAKLMFVTNEPSLEVVQQAFEIGSHGYVYKPRVQRDVLTVLEAILAGARFVSGGLERIARGDSLASHRHDVLFYSTDAIFIEALTRFIADGLCGGGAIVTLVTETHGQSLQRRLQALKVDLTGAIRERRYIALNIGEVLARVTVNGLLDRTQFLTVAEDVVTEAERAAGQSGRVAACGECSPTLWAQGDIQAAIQHEHLWDEIAKSRQIDVLCAYPLTARDEAVPAVRSLCAEHTCVEIR